MLVRLKVCCMKQNYKILSSVNCRAPHKQSHSLPYTEYKKMSLSNGKLNECVCMCVRVYVCMLYCFKQKTKKSKSSHTLNQRLPKFF